MTGRQALWRVLAALMLGLPLLLVLVGQLGLLQGDRGGMLRPPRPGASNVVSSQAGLHPHTALQRIEPLAFRGDPTAAMDRLEQLRQLFAGA